MNTIIAFCKDETGATAIEYGLIAAPRFRRRHHRLPVPRHLARRHLHLRLLDHRQRQLRRLSETTTKTSPPARATRPQDPTLPVPQLTCASAR